LKKTKVEKSNSKDFKSQKSISDPKISKETSDSGKRDQSPGTKSPKVSRRDKSPSISSSPSKEKSLFKRVDSKRGLSDLGIIDTKNKKSEEVKIDPAFARVVARRVTGFNIPEESSQEPTIPIQPKTEDEAEFLLLLCQKTFRTIGQEKKTYIKHLRSHTTFCGTVLEKFLNYFYESSNVSGISQLEKFAFFYEESILSFILADINLLTQNYMERSIAELLM